MEKFNFYFSISSMMAFFERKFARSFLGTHGPIVQSLVALKMELSRCMDALFSTL